MRKWLFLLLMTIPFCMAPSFLGTPAAKPPTFVFGVDATALVADECANVDKLGAGGSCVSHPNILLVPEAYRITRIVSMIQAGGFTTTEACDLEFVVNLSASTVVNQLGSDGCRSLTDACDSGPISISVDAGDIISLRTAEPSPDTYCVTGSSCTCTGASADVFFYIYTE